VDRAFRSIALLNDLAKKWLLKIENGFFWKIMVIWN
jgi:hypothetical protein